MNNVFKVIEDNIINNSDIVLCKKYLKEYDEIQNTQIVIPNIKQKKKVLKKLKKYFK